MSDCPHGVSALADSCKAREVESSSGTSIIWSEGSITWLRGMSQRNGDQLQFKNAFGTKTKNAELGTGWKGGFGCTACIPETTDPSHMSKEFLKGIRKGWQNAGVKRKMRRWHYFLPPFSLECTEMGGWKSRLCILLFPRGMSPHLLPAWRMLRLSKAGGYPEVKLYWCVLLWINEYFITGEREYESIIQEEGKGKSGFESLLDTFHFKALKLCGFFKNHLNYRHLQSLQWSPKASNTDQSIKTILCPH